MLWWLIRSKSSKSRSESSVVFLLILKVTGKVFPSIRKSCCCWYKSGVLPFISFPITSPSSFVTANSGIIAKAPLPCCFSIVYLKEVPSVSPFFFIFCKTGTPIVIVTISTLVSVIWKLTPLPLPLVPWTTSWLTLVG